uniref:TMC domain-containing protein n=1 Tax=Musca domestica TaxID=7370 RepID=A0A1I8MDH9_MUSDO
NTSTPTGTTPPPHQLSVTWATPPCGSNIKEFKGKPGTPLPGAIAAAAATAPTSGVGIEFSEFAQRKSPGFSIHAANADNNDEDNDEDIDDEEDYSVSVSAIMQRRASVRGYRRKSSSRNSRRASSPMDHVLDNAERRRSSVYTTSSDEGTNQESTQEQIFENIRLHKEVIQSVKLQPWPIRKKLKLVRQAKTYVARHEGALQERFAMSRSTRDLWARFKIVMAARWRHWKREIYSFLTVLIPWELRIKEIESHFGSGVASYFTFLRWLMYMNVMIALPLVLFVIGPEYFGTKNDEIDPRKRMTDRENKVAGNLLTIWEFEGYLKYSPMFYGYYSSSTGAAAHGYLLPLAYFLTAVVVYIYSFVATLRKMAENSRNSKLSSKDDECTFSWKLFTGWDFMIGHAETAHNRIASVVVGFKEALLEEAEKKKDTRNWRIILQRIVVNILIIALLVASGAIVVYLVNRSEDLAKRDDWLSKNAVNVTMNLLSFILPMIFEALGLFENWHPRQQLRLQLARIMILNLLTLYSLMFSFIYKIDKKEGPLVEMKLLNDTATAQLEDLIHRWEIYRNMTANLNGTSELATTTEAAMLTTAKVATKLVCRNVTKYCTKRCQGVQGFPTTATTMATVATTTFLLLNLTTTTVMPTTTTTTATSLLTNATSPITTTTTEISTEPQTTWTTLPTTTTMMTTTTEASTITTVTPPDTTHSSSMDVTATTLFANSPLTTQAATEITTEESTISTPSITSTTTTEYPGNDTLFEYYDYFAGMSLERQLADDKLKEDTESEDKKKRSAKGHRRRGKKKKKNQTTMAPTSFTEIFQTTVEPYSTSPPKVAKKSKGNNKISNIKRAKSLSLLPRSKYSRRDIESDETTTADKSTTVESTTQTEEIMTSTTYATTLPTTTTEDNTTPYPTTQDTTAAVTTTEGSAQTTTPAPPITTTTSKDILWEENTLLNEVLDFFTTNATTPRPPSNTLRPQEDPLINDFTTKPFFEEDKTVIYNLEDIQNGTLYICWDMECTPEVVADDDNQNTSLVANISRPITMSEEFEKNYTEIMKTLKKVELSLTTMCWETSLGQELAKVVVLDGITATVLSLVMDFLRALFVRYVNRNWCWDMEKTFPQYGDFKIAENILGLINNQGQVWMGIFFSPGLVIINLVKLVIMMYFRSWIVLTCNVPHEVVFKASKSNNFYLSLLLTMLFLCVLPVAYAIVWLRPSWHCGPYSAYNTTSEYITTITLKALPEDLHKPLRYMASASTVIPLLLLLILIIYYLVSLTGALREANQDLKTQLQKEREEERKKIFQVPEIKPAENSTTTMSNRWRKVLEASSPVSPTTQPDFESEEYKTQARKELISRIMKKALRKDSATSDEETFARQHGRDDDTDTEHHDSLPHDEDGNERRPRLSKLQEIRKTRKPSLVDIVQIANSERERVRSLRKQAMGSGGKGKTRNEKKSEENEQDNNNKEKEAMDNGNDPEIKTRIINERRQSLLRKKKEDEAYGRNRDKNEDEVGEKHNQNENDLNDKNADKTKEHEEHNETSKRKKRNDGSNEKECHKIKDKANGDGKDQRKHKNKDSPNNVGEHENDGHKDQLKEDAPRNKEKEHLLEKDNNEEKKNRNGKERNYQQNQDDHEPSKDNGKGREKPKVMGKEKQKTKDKKSDNEKSPDEPKIESPKKEEHLRNKPKEQAKDKDREKDQTNDVHIMPEKGHEKEKDKEKSKEIKQRIYESFRRKKRDNKEKTVTPKQSSLEKTSEEDINEETEPTNDNKKKSQAKKDKKLNSPLNDEEPLSYKIVDEKSPKLHDDKQSTPPMLEHLHNLGGKLKFKRHKTKPSTEPEVFKFDAEKLNKDADIATTPTWQHLEAELQSPRPVEDVSTPTTNKHHLGSDKFANLSRQSRKKIGSFLNLMKDAVSRPEQEQHSDTAIEIPSTPTLEVSSAINQAIMLPVAMHTATPTTHAIEPSTAQIAPINPSTNPTTIDSIQPYIMPRAPLEMAEDIDPPSYSNLMMSANETHIIATKDPEELDKPGPIIFQQRAISQRRRPIRQDSQSSNWSAENIPTITISTTPETDEQSTTPTVPTTPRPDPKVNVIKINIEHEM